MGARGCAARALLREQTLARPCAVTVVVRRNLTRALDRSSSDPGNARAYFAQHVVLGNYNCLTYVSSLLARLREDAELLARSLASGPSSSAMLRLHVDIALGSVFAEQVAVEGGNNYQWG